MNNLLSNVFWVIFLGLFLTYCGITAKVELTDATVAAINEAGDKIVTAIKSRDKSPATGNAEDSAKRSSASGNLFLVSSNGLNRNAYPKIAKTIADRVQIDNTGLVAPLVLISLSDSTNQAAWETILSIDAGSFYSKGFVVFDQDSKDYRSLWRTLTELEPVNNGVKSIAELEGQPINIWYATTLK